MAGTALQVSPPAHGCTPCFPNWPPWDTGEPCLEGSRKGCRGIPGPLQSQQVGVVRPRGIFVFAIPPRKSKPMNPCSGPCSLYRHGEQLRGRKFSRRASRTWDFCRGLQGVRCDFSELGVTGTLKFHEHKSRRFILFGLGPQPAWDRFHPVSGPAGVI